MTYRKRESFFLINIGFSLFQIRHQSVTDDGDRLGRIRAFGHRFRGHGGLMRLLSVTNGDGFETVLFGRCEAITLRGFGLGVDAYEFDITLLQKR